MEQYRLSPEELIWRCDPAQFEFETTEKLSCLEESIGQDRALTAIEFGLGIEADGFNIFILGEPGTGRSSTIKKLLEKRSLNEPQPDDWCYVHDLTTVPGRLIFACRPAREGVCTRMLKNW